MGEDVNTPSLSILSGGIPLTDQAPPVCPLDPSSYSNCAEVVTSHFHLDIRVDFNISAVGGNVTLNMTSQRDGLDHVVLDFQGMEVRSVE